MTETNSGMLKYKRILLFSILFLFFIQLLTVLIESVYVLDLLNTRLDIKVLGILFLFSPVLLLFTDNFNSSPVMRISGLILLFTRIMTPYVPPSVKIIASGIGTAAFLIYLPLSLTDSSGENERGGYPGIGQSIALAMILSLLFRILGSTRDISLHTPGDFIGWGLAITAGFFLLKDRPRNRKSSADRLKGEFSSVMGLFGIITLIYFIFQNPGILNRWSDIPYSLVMFLSAVVFTGYYISAGFWYKRFTVSEKSAHSAQLILVVWNILFIISLLSSILLNRTSFPVSPNSPAVTAFPNEWYRNIPTTLMLILSPVIFIDADFYAGIFYSNFISKWKLVS